MFTIEGIRYLIDEWLHIQLWKSIILTVLLII